MMQAVTSTTIYPTNLANVLPTKLRKFWRTKTSVLISVTQDSILIKKIADLPKNFQGIDDKLKRIGQKVNQKDIQDAIRWARKKI